MPESEFWAIIDRYKGETPSNRKKVTQALMQEFAEKKGPDVKAWLTYAQSFEERMYHVGMALQEALYAYQDQANMRLTPSDSNMRMLGYTIPLLGKSVYQKVKSDPSVLPTQNDYNFKWSGGDPNLLKFIQRSRISETTDLMYPYSSMGWKWPRGWK
jgi:hypothetical protein